MAAVKTFAFPFPALDISSFVGAFFEECESPDDNCFLNTRHLPELLCSSVQASAQQHDDEGEFKEEDIRTQDGLCVTSKSTIRKRYQAERHIPKHWCYDLARTEDGRTMVMGRARVTIDYARLQMLFHLPMTKAMRELRISTTTLKKTCRKFGIKRWPYRQIKHINNALKNK